MEGVGREVNNEGWKEEVLSQIRCKEEERKGRIMYSENDLLEEIRKRWLEILDEFKQEDKIVFAYFRGAEAVRVSFDNNSAKVFFRGLDISFIDYVEDPKIRSFIERVFQKVLGVRFPISCAIESKSWIVIREEEI